MREMAAAIPQLLHRTLSGKECWTRRRGSAPAPVAPSEFRGLAALGTLRHSVNGGRRKPNPSVTCQQWLFKTYSGQDKTMTQLPRRSSLPVEVIAGALRCLSLIYFLFSRLPFYYLRFLQQSHLSLSYICSIS